MKISRRIVAGFGIVYLFFTVWLLYFQPAPITPMDWQYRIFLETPLLQVWCFLIYPFLIIAIVFLMVRDQRINIIFKRVLGIIGIIYLFFVMFFQAFHQNYQFNNFLASHLNYTWVMRNVIGNYPVYTAFYILWCVYLAIAIIYLIFWDWFIGKTVDTKNRQAR